MCRCNTDLRRRPNPSQPLSLEDHYRLRKELTASVAARKSLEKMFSSLGKEKEFIAAELARKVQETQGLEEHVSDLKAQNEMLLEKVTAFKGGGGGASAAVAALEERNRALSEQLLKALERYRGLKRRVKEVKEENARAREAFEAIEREATEGIDSVGGVRRLVLAEADGRRGGTRKVEATVAAVERALRGILVRAGREDGLPVAA
ncbi:hypothetical protein QJS10_CPA09g00683 [Acorus calamus]|uniref:Uncharacterized protein n=1 Tax=Acorus calamus TaxID=4465 RepID=A0AAV9E382_ACOCL|nr:hypothetical protein QJS10_CPA09g00683 [Acorus calamus]